MIAVKHALQIAGDLVELGKLSDAADVLAPIVATPDAPTAALWLAGRIAGLSSRPRAAIALLERALALAPTAAPIYEDLAFAWGAAGVPARASEVLRAGLAALGPHPALLATAAAYDLEQMDRDAARARLADPAARAIYPRVRGLLAIHDGDWAAARDAFAEAFGVAAAPRASVPPRLPPHYAPSPAHPAAALGEVAIATSLSPRGGAAQQAAVESWLRFAARVISVNSAAECAALAPDYPGVRFVVTHRDASDRVGKPLVLIDDILDALAASGAAQCGIVNGDVRLADPERLAADVAAAGPEALTVCHRLDVDAADDASGSLYTTGFDAFFFPASRIAGYRGSGLALGAPWWDYLFPLLAIVDAQPLASPSAASIRHVRHLTRWSTHAYVATACLWLDRIRAASAARPDGIATEFVQPFVALFDQANPWTRQPLSADAGELETQKHSLAVLATATTHLIRTQAATIAAPPPR